MRAVFVGISVLLITGCGLAQTDMRTQSIQNLGTLSPQREFAMDQLPPIILDPSPRQSADTAKNENENELPDVNDQGRCYSIRA